MIAHTKDLWTLALERTHVDPHDLAEAVEAQVVSGDLDYRTRLLIRDSLKALRHYWHEERVAEWLSRSPVGEEIEAICRGPWECDRGFPSLMRRVMDVTRPETIREYLRQVGTQIFRPVRITIGGSVALILAGYLLRRTQDIDVVDEVPPEIRSQHKMLDELAQQYGLELGHFQRHYLPMGWENRVHTQASFGQLQVALVDVYDVFLSKLNSARDKDFDDLRTLKPQIDKEIVIRKLKDTMAPMLAVPALREKAEKNWYILYGEPLPT